MRDEISKNRSLVLTDQERVRCPYCGNMISAESLRGEVHGCPICGNVIEIFNSVDQKKREKKRKVWETWLNNNDNRDDIEECWDYYMNNQYQDNFKSLKQYLWYKRGSTKK